MELSKRKVIFVPRLEGESKEDFEIRVDEVIAENEVDGYKLVEKKKRGREYQLTFEG